MERQKHKLRRNQRVRLKKEGQDALYEFAAAGSEGWVRDATHDKYGYPTVFIEWDRDHWTYNGEPDRWALEAHFDPVEDNKMSDGNKDFLGGLSPEEFATAFAKFLTNQQAPETNAPASDSPAAEKVAEQAIRDGGAELIKDADSFVLVATVRNSAGDLIPRVAQYYRSPEGGLLVELHVSKLATIAFEELAVARIREIMGQSG
jgi:hypothetical protein